MIGRGLKAAARYAMGAGFAVALLGGASTNASAGIINIDGVNVATGPNLGISLIDENTVTSVGQNLRGLGFVSSISDVSNNVTYTYGQNNAFLTFVFSGFTATSVTAPTGTTDGTILFSGGTVNFYVESAAPNLTTGSQLTDFANASSGTLWLTASAAPLDAAGDTLKVSIPAGATLLNFQNATGNAFFDVTGGDAFATFNSNNQFDAFDTNGGTCFFGIPTAQGCADVRFSESSSTGISGDFRVSGSANIKADAIPEPATLALFGTGLTLLGWASRRRRRS